MASWRFYSNVAVADTLQVTGGGNLSTSATSIFAGSGAPSGYPTQFPWTLRLEPGTASEELVSVSSGSGTSAAPWIVTRGYDGTTAKVHNAGTPIAHGSSAGDFTTAATHYAQGNGSGVHGLPASAWATAVWAKIGDIIPANSTTASVSFGSIPATYSHLLVIAQGRITEATVQSDDVLMQINGDTTASYSYITQFASNPGGGFLFLPNYTGTAFNKTAYGMSGGGYGTTSFMDIRTRVGVYNPTTQAAITSLSFTAPASSNFLAGSRFTLYGIN